VPGGPSGTLLSLGRAPQWDDPMAAAPAEPWSGGSCAGRFSSKAGLCFCCWDGHAEGLGAAGRMVLLLKDSAE